MFIKRYIISYKIVGINNIDIENNKTKGKEKC